MRKRYRYEADGQDCKYQDALLCSNALLSSMSYPSSGSMSSFPTPYLVSISQIVQSCIPYTGLWLHMRPISSTVPMRLVRAPATLRATHPCTLRHRPSSPALMHGRCHGVITPWPSRPFAASDDTAQNGE